MITWKRLSFSDQTLITNTLIKSPLPLSDYPFTNLWMWDAYRNYHIATVEDLVCIRFKENNREFFLYPLGEGSRIKTVELLYQEQLSKQMPFYMRAIPEEGVAELKNINFSHTITPEEGRFDYVYSFEELLTLRGNRFQAKRNLIHQFENNYEFTYEEISLALLPKVKEMEEKWFKEKKSSHKSPEEHRAAMRALEHFFSLNVLGGALIVDDQVIAYSIAEYLGSVMLLIHLEKAFNEYKGAYQLINQQLLKHLVPTLYINKEENLGFSELAKAKDSYHPLMVLKKFLLEGG